MSQKIMMEDLPISSMNEEKIQKPEKAKNEMTYTPEKTERVINKKKLNKIKVPEKYEKVLEGIINDTLETVDFTNAELGDNNVALISELLRGTKAKTVKLIRNKLEDETIHKILPYLGNVITLNLSQNFLTDRTLDILVDGRAYLENIKTIILSQNKIIERKHKTKLEKLRKLDLIVSV